MASSPKAVNATKLSGFPDLPPELRNRLYGLAFTLPPRQTTVMPLGKAASPGEGLLYVRAQIDNEAGGL